jgi:hypothetical protein
MFQGVLFLRSAVTRKCLRDRQENRASSSNLLDVLEELSEDGSVLRNVLSLYQDDDLFFLCDR